MPWFRLEGRGAFHHKVLAAGNEAYGAWCRAGQWCSDQLTDGRVPRAVADQIAKPKVWAKLVEAGLMHEAEGSYQIHDYLDWNPSSEQERAKRDAMREKRREAGRAGGIRSGEVRRGEVEGKQSGSTDEPNTKQVASTGASPETKQNEAPSPSPSPSISHTHTSAGARESRPSSQAATTIALPFGPAEAEVVTADALLRAVSGHPMLATLHDDRRWATNAVGWLQAAGCRAEDAAAAVGAFVTDKAGAAPPDGPTLDAFVRDGIGRYLKNAKQHGDAHRATARVAAERQARPGSRRGPTPQPGAFQILNKNPDPVSAEERERPLV